MAFHAHNNYLAFRASAVAHIRLVQGIIIFIGEDEDEDGLDDDIDDEENEGEENDEEEDGDGDEDDDDDEEDEDDDGEDETGLEYLQRDNLQVLCQP